MEVTPAPALKEEGTYVFYRAQCPHGCDWQGGRRQHESDAWPDLLGHLRQNHMGDVRSERFKRTVLYEPIEASDLAE